MDLGSEFIRSDKAGVQKAMISATLESRSAVGSGAPKYVRIVPGKTIAAPGSEVAALSGLGLRKGKCLLGPAAV